MNNETMLITNKHDDLSTLRRAQIGISVAQPDNSSLLDDSSIVLSKRGFLELPNLFKYANYIEVCTKECYIFCISSMLSIAVLSLLFAFLRGDALFEPIHFLILLALEVVVGEFLFNTIKESDEVTFEQTEQDEFKGYSLDEKSRKVMIYNICYSVIIPTFVFAFDFIPNEYGYFLNEEGIKHRYENGVPQINSFVFTFLLISRV
jgi:magnesium-transporting ATPase (P-type)